MTMDSAADHIFGLVVMNDWSARDIQKWEYVPLGPFGAKNWASTISPWVVTLDALEPFRAPTSAGKQENPEPLPYLKDPNYGSYDIDLSVLIKGEDTEKAEVVSKSNFKNLYWNVKQQLVHHSVTGCNMRAGDLLGSGTISGADQTAFGSMLELCWKGTREVPLGESGAVRKFLKDGDYVEMRGDCKKEGFGRVGFGKVGGNVLPAGAKLVKGEGNGVWVKGE
jgi:fumarylacetoacetase